MYEMIYFLSAVLRFLKSNSILRPWHLSKMIIFIASKEVQNYYKKLFLLPLIVCHNTTM